MSLFNSQKHNFSKLNNTEQLSLHSLLDRIKHLVNSRAFLYQPEEQRVIVRSACYGTLDPTDVNNTVTQNATEGQIYFHIQDLES